jgi:hypothetical protein
MQLPYDHDHNGPSKYLDVYKEHDKMYMKTSIEIKVETGIKFKILSMTKSCINTILWTFWIISLY